MGDQVKLYKHKSLTNAKSYIRVFVLLPGVRRERLRGCLEECNINEPSSGLSYEALSYRWQDINQNTDPSDVNSILIDDHLFPISESLAEGLHVFRREDSSRRLWIDQICINQVENNAEKEDQLLIMGTIYAKSLTTLVWLGPHCTPSEESGLEFIQSFQEFRLQVEEASQRQIAELEANRLYVEQRTGEKVESSISELVMRVGLIHNISLLSTEEQLEQGIHSARSLPLLSEEDISRVASMFKRDWFLRTWPMQEVVLSHQKQVFCGTHHIDWEDLGCFASYLMHRYKEDLILDPREVSAIEAAALIWFYSRTYDGGFPLLEILRATRRYETGRSKDKVYALYGMIDFELRTDKSRNSLASAATRDGTVPKLLEPDYDGKTDIDVYYDVARYLLERDKSLEVLTHRQFVGPGELPSPSWVPRWDLQEKHTPFWLPHDDSFNFSACTSPDEQIKCEKIARDGTLFYTCTVHGIMTTMVVSQLSTDSFSWRNEDTWDWSTVVRLIAAVASLVPESDADWHEKYGTLVLQLALLLTAGRRGAGYIVDYDDKDQMVNHIKGFIALVKTLGSEDVLQCSETEQYAFNRFSEFLSHTDTVYSATWKTTLSSIDGRKLSYGTRCIEALRNRAVFNSEIGLLGLGPACVEIGDRLMILKGGKVPFLFREVPPDSIESKLAPYVFRFVGEVYGGVNLMREEEEMILYEEFVLV
jgi:hypothetical protein